MGELTRWIHLGVVAEGERLPAERKLAARLGVSRDTVRDALRVLADWGHVEARRGSTGGSYVIGPRASRDERRADLIARISELDEAIELRLVLETAAAEMAAMRRSKLDLEQMRRALAALESATTVSAFRRADNAFHMAVAGATRNALLARATEDARVMMFAPVDVLPYDLLLDTSLRAHASILGAIQGREADAAAAAMTAHIRASHHELRHALGLARYTAGPVAR